MPRKPALSKKIIIQTFLQFKSDILDADGQVFPPSHHIWKKISETIQSRYSAKHLYTLIKLNRYNLLESLDLPSQQKIEISSENEQSNNDVSSSEISDSELLMHNGEEIEYKVKLTPDEWKSIEPTEKIYHCSEKYKKNKKYMVLKPHIWPQLIHLKFWETSHLQCNITFKRARINLNSSPYCVIDGKCNTCNSKFYGYIKSRSENNKDVELIYKYKGLFKKCIPNEKRCLKGLAKNEALAAMCERNVAPSEYRKEIANSVMEFGDFEPPIVPSANALRIAKCRELKKEHYHENPVMSINYMKYADTLYYDSIKAIGLDPFYVYYWMPYQLHLYNDYCRKRMYSKISIDATGSVVKKIKKPFGNKSSHIFLYDITVNDEQSNCQYSVCNMLSEKHDSNTIFQWLSSWIKDGARLPSEVTSDASLALLSAISQTFNKLNLNDYLKICADIVLYSRKVDMPKTYVRCDVAHTMKTIASWNDLQGKDFRIRNLFIRSMAQIVLSKTLSDVTDILTSIFTVALSDSEGNDESTGEPTPCEIEKQKLRKLIATGEKDDTFNEILNQCLIDDKKPEEEQFYDDLESLTFNGFDDFSKSIEKDCIFRIKEIKGDHDNHQYLPSLVKTIIKFMKFLPLWSGIMIPEFLYGSATASSAPVESNFNNIKHRIFKHVTLPIRCDSFLKTHIKSLEGTMKLAAANMRANITDNEVKHPTCNVKYFDVKVPKTSICEGNNLKDKTQEDKDNDNFSQRNASDESIYVENWKGQIVPPKKKMKYSYLVPSKELMKVNFSDSKTNRPIGLLRNGNLFHKSNPFAIDSEKYTVSNTCAFDCLAQIFASAFVDSDKYFQYFENIQNDLFVEIIKNITESKINQKTYKNRIKLLRSHCKTQNFPNEIIHISAETTISYLAHHLLKSYPSATTELSCNNSTCNYAKHSLSNAVISINLENESLNILQKKLDNYCFRKEVSCTQKDANGFTCNGKRRESVVLSEKHLILEVMNCDYKYWGFDDIAKDPETVLDDIPKNLKNNDTEYHLRGVASFSSSQRSVNIIGHYISFCRRSNEIWEEYNDLSNRKHVCTRKKRIRCQLLFYTV